MVSLAAQYPIINETPCMNLKALIGSLKSQWMADTVRIRIYYDTRLDTGRVSVILLIMYDLHHLRDRLRL